MSHTDPVAVEIFHIAAAIRRLGVLCAQFTCEERLKLGEHLRDVADAVDYGGKIDTIVTLPSLYEMKMTTEPAPPPLPTPEVQVAVRPLGAVRRPSARPARPRLPV